MDSAICQHMKRAYKLTITETTAETIKIKIGSAFPHDESATMDISGKDLVSGLPKTVKISEEEVRNALQEPVSSILEAVKATLEHCPPELAADLIESGIMLAGGGALLKGLDKLLAEETGLPVLVAEEPLQAVARGTGIALEMIDTVQRARTRAGK